MQITYIHHSGFLVETDHFYYLFDYETGQLPVMDVSKPIFVLSSHSHSDHYNPEIFPMLSQLQMAHVRAVLSDDITPPANVDVLQVSPEQEYSLDTHIKLSTFRSTDQGVAFLIEEDHLRIYHAGDLNDWVWEEESNCYNTQMTENYRKQIQLLSAALHHQPLDAAFVVLDPRQEKDYDRGLCYFLEHISAKQVYPMHYWDDPSVIRRFLQDHPQYQSKLKTE